MSSERSSRKGGKGAKPSVTSDLSADSALLTNAPDWVGVLVKGQTDLGHKIDAINSRFDSLHSDIHDPTEGLKVKVEASEFICNNNKDELLRLREENAALRVNVSLLNGMMSKVFHELSSARDRINNLTARSMRDNILIPVSYTHLTLPTNREV